MTKYKIGFGFFILTIFYKCTVNFHACNFEVTPEFIRTSCSLHNGLEIEKLKNISEMNNNIPKEYEIEFKASYGAESDAILAKAMDNKLKRIKFKKEINGYNWIWHGKKSVTSIMPFDFEPNSWYIIGDLYENGVPSVLLYVYVNENGSFKTYRKDTPTNW